MLSENRGWPQKKVHEPPIVVLDFSTIGARDGDWFMPSANDIYGV